MQETSQEPRGGARQGTRCCSRSTQQILDVSVPFISEKRLERTSKEGPLILKMTAEGWSRQWLRWLNVAVDEHGATAGMHHAQVI